METVTATKASDLIGRHVIVRCRDAGVHAGELVEFEGRGCTLKDARRLWYWKAAKGFTLSDVANAGLAEGSKVSSPVATIVLTENCEIILNTAVGEASIREIEAHEPR